MFLSTRDYDNWWYRFIVGASKKNCEKILKKYKPKILIEISESSLINQGIDFLETIKFLNDIGYTCYYPNKILKEFKRKSLNKDEVMNIFCTIAS